MNEKHATQPPDDHWLVRPATIRKLWIGFGIVLALLSGADFLVHKHDYVGPDGWFGFYWVYGFGACVAMVIFAKVLGVLIKRPDSYYGDE
ncbi:MAG: hypothetical protein OXC10_11615 [Rhodospirillaceae bacterium]|nr:hypothetical protein [Rhodospirillaceae bacterium]